MLTTTSEASDRYAGLAVSDDVTGRWRYFERWCAAHGRVSLPAEETTVALFLFAHHDEWKRATQEGYRSAIAVTHAVRGHAAPDGGIVRRLGRAVVKQRGSRPVDVKEPMRVDVLKALLRPDLVFDPVREAFAVRTRLGAVLVRNHAVPARQVVRLDDADLDVEYDTLIVSLPACPAGGGPKLEARVITCQRTGRPDCLVGLVERYRALRGPGGLIFGWSTWEGIEPRTSMRAANLRQSIEDAARRAGLRWPQSAKSAVPNWDEEQWQRFLSHCDRRYLTRLRDTTAIAVGWSAARRPIELVRLQLAHATETPLGWELEIWDPKTNKGAIETVALHHLPDHPPYCGACLLRRWSVERGAAPGPLFPSLGPARRREAVTSAVITDAIRTRAVAAGLEGDWSAKSLRSGVVTTLAEANEELDVITGLTGHLGEEVPILHYVLTRMGATHHLGAGR